MYILYFRKNVYNIAIKFFFTIIDSNCEKEFRDILDE